MTGLFLGAAIAPAAAQSSAAARTAADEVRQSRYQISQMERMLEGAVEHGASVTALAAEATPDPVLTDPQEAYRAEVKQQIMDAMLDYSHPLAIGVNEWLGVGARSHSDRPLLAPADSDARTVMIRIQGRDL